MLGVLEATQERNRYKYLPLETLRYVAAKMEMPLARERLGRLSGGVRFVDANFKHPNWNIGLPTFDAVISMQSVHEVRHKKRVPALYAAVRKLLHKHGVFLVCDHYAGEGGMADTELYMTVAEQREALRNAGFSEVTLLLEKGGLAMWRARNESGNAQ